MSDKLSTPNAHAILSSLCGAVLFLVGAAQGALGMTAAAADTDNEAGVAAQMAVAKRQGLCRAMDGHLHHLRDDPPAAERNEALRALSLLASDLLNHYSREYRTEDSRAAPTIWGSTGMSTFREHRDALREEVTAARHDWDPAVPERLAQACLECHRASTTEEPEISVESEAFPRLGGSVGWPSIDEGASAGWQ